MLKIDCFPFNPRPSRFPSLPDRVKEGKRRSHIPLRNMN
ncbi:hypothetical protein IAD21_01445 [Abditibacteriota bacterium]|nr:hypothetical protein IAD21_01445 [Abditibacteriota bacterium]